MMLKRSGIGEKVFSVFSRYSFSEYIANSSNRVYVAPQGSKETFEACCEALLGEGFSVKEMFSDTNRSYAALYGDGVGVFLNYFPALGELRGAVEENCAYFSYQDAALPFVVAPQVTQISLEDFGMSYALRLSDGRFIVLDGGWNFAPDAERLYQCLLQGSSGSMPVIAAWILTHPHRDHYQCFIGFTDAYRDKVTVEKVLLYFPEADDPVYDADFTYVDPRVADSDERANIPRLWERISRWGAAVYTPHTGQRYSIGDARCEVLSSPDDVLGRSSNVNALSLVLRMELGGQVILWTADASFGIGRIGERYGTYLKADILQVPHHGFQSGDPKAEIKGYDLVAPSVCFLPVSDYNAYTAFCIHRESTGYLMLRGNVEELIAGSVQRTLTLPYSPSPTARETLARRCAHGLATCGTMGWIFTGLSTDCPEDFVFDFLNTTYLPAQVEAELFFSNKEQRILHIRFSVPALSTHSICVVGEGVDGDGVWFNEYSLKKQPIPEHASFALRLTSDLPIVVSHSRHKPAHTAEA